MTEEKITDFYGKILGYIKTDEHTKNRTAYNFYRQILGRYDAKRNVTTDFYGRILSRGDTLSSLISNSQK